MRKIAIVTGTRAEYGILEPLIQKIHADKNLELLLYVTGMHLSGAYGKTVNNIKPKFPIAGKIDIGLKKNNTGSDMGKSTAKGITGFIRAFESDHPDFVVVLGDRIEPFSASIAALFLKIPVVHINGGDCTFTLFDESLRHAITKMASLHFPASAQSATRIIKMGEEGWRVHTVGALGLDSVLHTKTTTKKAICSQYHLDEKKPLVLVVFHPVTTEWENAGRQFDAVLEAIARFNCQKLVIYPNSDAGSFQIIQKLEQLRGKPGYSVHKSLPHEDYVAFMQYSDLLVGNSSSGILEAPSLGLPVVNIGSRQDGRERASNVIDVPSYSPDLISAAINRALTDMKFRSIVSKKLSPYGDGHAAEKIVSVLKNIEINVTLIQKRMTY